MIKRTRAIIGGLGLAAGLTFAVAGCAGHDHCWDCGRPSFTGIYEGSGINASGLFSVNFTIAPGGAISGSETQITGGKSTWTVSGTTDDNGNASITLTPASGTPITETGSLGFAAPGVIQVAFYQNGSNTPIPVSMANSAGLFSGNYAGSYAVSSGSTGTGQLSIDVNGNIAGFLAPTTGAAWNLTGTVSPLGVASLTVTPPTGDATTYTGGAAYNISEKLLFTAASGNTTLSLNLTFQSNARLPAFRLRK
jgi:hypothetical protein